MMLAAEGGDEEAFAKEGDTKLSLKPSMTTNNGAGPRPSRQRLVFADPAAFR